MNATIILAAGDFPRKGTKARRQLESARRVVCCDGAADAYRKKMRREPTIVIGDGDSLRGTFTRVVRVAEQDTNDLEKAFRYCALKGWERPIVLGAMGKREDHALGNLFRAMEHGVEVVTDHGRFVPIRGRATFNVAVGAAISIFAANGTRMKSAGLVWPLGDVIFKNFYCATLNRAAAKRITLWSSKKAYIYFNEKRA